MKTFSLRFEKPDGVMGVDEYISLKDYFDKNLLLGVEMERAIRMEQRSVASLLNAVAVPYGQCHSQEYTFKFYKKARTMNDYNIAFVTTDGTVTGGNEIIYAGNNEGFLWNQEKLAMAEKRLEAGDCRHFDISCSNHITILSAYNKKVHGNVMKNVFNIVRAFSSALYWLGGGNNRRIVRGINRFCKPLNQYTPNTRSLVSLKGVCSKYSILNLSKQNIGEDSQSGHDYLDGLFFEFRNMDGIRVPSAISAMMSLYKALIYKSAELSMDGIVQISGLSSNWKNNKRITYKIQQGEYLSADEKVFCSQEAKNLIDFLYVYLKKDYERLPDILTRIAENPVHRKYVQGKTNTQIEKDYMVAEKDITEQEKKILYEIIKGTTKANSIGEWKKNFANQKKCSVRWVEKKLKKFSELKKLEFVFDSEQKTMRLA